MDDIDLVVMAAELDALKQDKEYWKDLKTTIKRDLEESFEPTKCMNEFVEEEVNERI